MASLDKLTKADVAALRQYAIAYGHGIRWKGALRLAWETGVYFPCTDPDVKATLQSLRNRLGTSWLSKFNFA
jgi:hypothetical protein